MRWLVAGALTVAALLGTVVVARSTPDDGGETLERRLGALVTAGMPGALVRVRDGDTTVEVARGEATPGIRFRVGSVTKTFVGVLTLALVDSGVVTLDDNVETYLPGLLRDGSHVTIRALLTHRAGLFDYTSDPALLRDDLPPRALVRIADRRERTPGVYSSTNYLALGLVLEEATGTGLAELLRREVFDPFDLRQTTFEPGVVRGRHLHGHGLSSRDGVATGTPRDTSASPAASAWAAAAVVSTASDLDRFFTELGRRGLSRRMAPADGERYGLGLARGEAPCGGAFLGHTGNLLGTVTVVRMRGDRLAVVAGNAYPFTREVGKRFADLLRTAICG